MIKLVKGKSNSIAIKVRSLIDYKGFSANLLMMNGLQKFVPDISAQNPRIVFMAADIENFFGKGQEGVLTVSDGSSTEKSKQRIWFSLVDIDSEAINFQDIYINIVAEKKTSGCGDAGLEARISALEIRVDILDDHLDEMVTKVINDVLPTEIKPTVEEVVEEEVKPIVDSKIATSISNEIEPMVDDKIAESIGAINNILDELNGEEL